MADTTGGRAALSDLVDPEATFTVLGDGFVFTEGPSWSVAGQYLVFSDIAGDTRYRWSDERGVEVLMRPAFKGNGTVFDADGHLLVCEHGSSTLVRLRPNGDRQLLAYHYEGRYLNSPNDVIVRSDGSIYFSDPDYGRRNRPTGIERKHDLDFQGVYRIAPGGGDLELLVDRHEFEQPNGLCFSPDEQLLYIDDVDDLKVFDVAPDGSLSNGRVVQDGMGSVRLGPDAPQLGNPDGVKCDEHGNVWCTARGGIWVLDPAGQLLGILETPEVAVNLVWGGPDLHTLMVTMNTSVRAIPTKVGPAPLPSHRAP